MLMKIGLWIRRLVQAAIALIVISLIIYAIYDYQTDPTRQVYTFDRLHYDVTLLSNGSAAVVETRDYTFSHGSFSYGWFDLAAEARAITVSENGRPYEKLASLPMQRRPGQYAILDAVGGQVRVEWTYEAQSPEKRSFQISYQIPDAAIAYVDCVVYFQKYLSENNTADIGRITVSVRLPDGADAGNTLIWGHGPAYGSLAFAADNPQRVDLEIDRIAKNQYVEARFLLPAGSLPEAVTRTDRMYTQVLSEETEAAQTARRELFLTRLSAFLAAIAGMTLLVLLVVLYRRHRPAIIRLPADPVPPYLREIPTESALPVVARLYRFYRKQLPLSELISLTILDLIRRDILQIQMQQGKRKPEISLQLNPNDDGQYTVGIHEAPVLDFLYRDAAEGQTDISLRALRKYCRSSKHRHELENLMQQFESAHDQLWQSHEYEDTKRKIPVPVLWHRLAGFLAALAGFLCLTLLSQSVLAVAGLTLFVFGLAALIINLIIFRKRRFLTQIGENELVRWQALARFFKEFSAFDEKDLPEVGLWEDLLIYAAALSLAERVMKQLKMLYPQPSDPLWQNRHLYLMHGPWLDARAGRYGLGGLSELQASLGQIMRSAQTVVSSHQASQGGGGGFSGGGSSGGGGAGGSSGGGMG
jgi:uncharacterized membrane protein YgcG